jgi:hypothetical protein
MASEAPGSSLPILYSGLEPLSSVAHADFKLRQTDMIPQVAQTHAFPITVDEFSSAQRHYPIVFSTGDNPVPLVLMGLNEGVNVFFNDDGSMMNTENYIPAYIRRWPFVLARLQQGSDELSLCFDPDSGVVGPFEEGQPLFVDGKAGEPVTAILKFCEEFELSAQRTNAFMEDLKASGLLMEGEVSIQPEGASQPFTYRGFQMVSEEKLRELRGDELRKMNQNGMLPLLYAHLFSLGLMREVFAKQIQQQKGPPATVLANPAGAA